MANIRRKITLTSTGGDSGPNYKVEWSTDGINYSESIDCGNVSLPSVGSFVTCSIDENASSMRLTSLNIFCTNSVTESIIPPLPPGVKNMIIESNNNTSWYAGTASTDDIFINRFDTYNFKQDTYPTGFTSSAGTRTITGSANLDTFIGWPLGYGRFSVTQSLFGDTTLITTANGIYDTRVTSGVTTGPGTINYNLYNTIKSVTTINDAPITGSRRIEYRVKNNTSASIDRLWWAFDFSDTPNYRKPTDGDGILSGYVYYVSASNVPVGDSVYSTVVNFTSSLVQPPQDYNLYCDPDDASSVLRYNFTGIIRQDGVSQATFNAFTASAFNQFPTASYLNPMTWTTCSFELTASVTESAPPAPPSASFCTKTLYFDVTATPSPGGWGTSTDACQGTGTPLTVYHQTGSGGNCTASFQEVFNNGWALFLTSSLTSPLTGSFTWYKTVQAPNSGNALQIDNDGFIQQISSPC